MKKFYLLIVLLVHGYGFAQDIGTYTVTLGISDIHSKITYSGNCGSRLQAWLNFSNADPQDFFYQPVGDGADLPRNWTVKFPSTQKLTRINYYSEARRYHGGFTRKCKNDRSSNENINVSYGITEYYVQNYFTNVYNLTATLKILPDLHIQTINESDSKSDILPTTEKITIKSNTGFLSSEYNWQYSLNPLISSSWVSLPQFNTSSISVNALDILQVLNETSHGKMVYFRQIAYNGDAVSNTVGYSVRLSAPKVNLATPVPPSCSDTNDGSIKLVFNRNLYPGEQLNYTLLDFDTNTPTNYNGTLSIAADKSFYISGLSKGKYILQLIGFKDGLSTSVMPADLYALTTFTISSPPSLNFTLDTKNVQCNGGQDGAMTINPTGGTRTTLGSDSYSLDNGLNWTPFPNNKPYTIDGLLPRIYNVMVKDMNGCIAKNSDETYKVWSQTISQPISPLSLNYTLIKDPTFNGAANGSIVASITGGTINDNNSYEYEWKNSSGVSLPTIAQYNSTDRTYNITLSNAIAGEYKLTVYDKNYRIATNKGGCSVIESSIPLSQPNPIEILLTQTQEISCNSSSLAPLENATKASDAVLKATVQGGIPFTGSANNGLPYIYNWSKYDAIADSWILLADSKTDEALNLSEGEYALNVIDANGIVQGTYSTTALIQNIPTKKNIVEPSKMELSFNSGNVSCYQGNNGWLTANVSGGAGDYTYTWYNTRNGIINNNKLTALTVGTYSVEGTDKNGCFVTGKYTIDQPMSAVAINYKVINPPTFSGATNGKMVVEVTGGTPNDDLSYNYLWTNKIGASQETTAVVQNGVYIITLDGVPADDYFLTVKDKNYNQQENQIINCSILESKQILVQPDPLKVVFEISNTISCNSGNEYGNNTDVVPNDGQRDESQDGILIAHVTGGIPLAATTNNGLPYYFYWKKQLQDGSWIALPDIKGETASNLSHGNYALNVKDRNGIVLGTYVNNQLIQEIDATQFMQEPSKLSVTITKGDVFCNGGNDGWATANVVGGTPSYNYNWSNGVSVFENTILKAGKYVINIADAKGCATQNEVTILEPIDPIVVKVENTINPSFYQATNGEITVTVKGGTLFPDNSYWFEWKNSKGVVQKSTMTSFIDGVYTITVSDLPEETYNLTIRDANYSVATSKMGCTVLNTMVSLEDPDPLEVTFEIVNTISCHVDNEFGNEKDTTPSDGQRDESQDGILVAHVKGGIKLGANQNNGLPYYYTWKKQKGDGSWSIWNDQDETAQNVSEGTYALNIEDANGIKLGTYTNNILVKEIDATQYMKQPNKLNLTFTKRDVGCTAANDGWAEAHVSGGTAPYTYQWTNEATTPGIDNLTTNNYFVLVTDAKGCSIQGSIFVGDPNGILTTETVKNPICYEGNDGAITLNVNGGNLPYSYLWNTGATTRDIANLIAGNYEVTISCPNCCVYKKRFVLQDPEQLTISLGPDRTLCIDQSVDLNATIQDSNAQYIWTATNGFTSNQAKVQLSKAGTYHVTATSSLGCVTEDEIIIKTIYTAISAEFLLSSIAYLDEEIILVNTSTIDGETSQWLIPDEVTTVEQKEKYITLKFNAVGTYALGLQQTQGECYATYTKNIVVEKRTTVLDPNSVSKFIKDFIVTPNPNDGNFKVFVNFEETASVNLRLFSGSGLFTAIQKKDSGKKKYELDFNTNLAAGMYILVLETEQQTLVKKIIIY